MNIGYCIATCKAQFSTSLVNTLPSPDWHRLSALTESKTSGTNSSIKAVSYFDVMLNNSLNTFEHLLDGS